ncbi:MAG: hypothetical protein N5P05_004230 (plasmid) [Chroococcopsis gigantea SAG 12.99]|jgi:uncharacterized protein (DUF697 family)|nr:hypothetical protein [Chroococcopsis gigantea SAG 12.99]
MELDNIMGKARSFKKLLNKMIDDLPIPEDKIKREGESLKNFLKALIDDPSIPENDKLTVIIHLTSLTCAVVAVQPIPFADLFILSPIQVVMVTMMSRVLGNPLGKQGPEELIASIVGVVGWGVLAQQLVLGAYKTVIPFLGAITTVPLVYAATMGLGYAAKAILEARVKDQKISDEELREIGKQAEQKAKAKDISLENAMQELAHWREKARQYEAYQQELAQQETRISQLLLENITLSQEILKVQQSSKNTRELEKTLALLAKELTDKNQELQKAENLFYDETREKSLIDEQKRQLNHKIEQLQLTIQELTQERDDILTTENQEYGKLNNELAEKHKQINNLNEKRLESFRKRINVCYPNIRISEQVLKQIVGFNKDNDKLNLLEKQLSLLNHDKNRVNFKCTIQGTRNKSVQEIEFGDDGRLYTHMEGNVITIVRVGVKGTQPEDIGWIKKNY